MALVVCVAALGAIVLAVEEPGHAAFPGKNGKIAFVRSVGGNEDIFVMGPDGSSPQNMTNNAANDTQPAWRADGDELLFTSTRSGTERIWKLPGTGGTTSLVTLSPGTPQESSPAWGPDGRITWETTINGGYEIYAQNPDGSPRRLTFNDPISDRAPAWSPDGTKIAFWSARNGNRDVFVMNADGSGVMQLTTYADSDRDPVWSPDGTKIVFERTLPGGNSDLFVMNATGTNQTNVTNNPSDDRNAAWSPDGTKIAFRSSRDGNSEIYVMNADGTGVQRLTNDPAIDDDPDWQPANEDQDFDGLLDSWETNGYDADGDGKVDVDLKAMGADPRHKDVFVEVDKMLGHPFHPQAAALVVQAFAAAPVVNPDGKPGITMHIDNGSGTIMDPATGARWGDRSRSNALPHQDVLGKWGADHWLEWGAIDSEIKAKRFEPERRRIFHYAIIGHRHGSPTEGSSGYARDYGSSDFLVTLAGFCPPDIDCSGTIDQQANTFMHEIGHNFNLRHGGGDDFNRKPNYLSVMNYAFQFPGLTMSGRSGVLDYSRIAPAGTGGATNVLGTLNESALNEGAGWGAFGPLATSATTVTNCPSPPGGGRLPAIRAGAMDWNCNGRTDAAPVQVDLNGDGAVGQLESFDDWSHLVYEGGTLGAGAMPTLPSRTNVREPTRTELLDAARRLLNDAKAPTITVTGPRTGRARRGVRLLVTSRDQKGLALVVVTIDKKPTEFQVSRRGQKVLRLQATVVRRGVRVIKVGAIDRAGNRSKTVTVRVRMR
jgi:Tol biopolymer transport system component